MSTDVVAVVEDAWNETEIYRFTEADSLLVRRVNQLFCRDGRFAIWMCGLGEDIWLFDMNIGINRFAI